jgi:hypothetical protein
MTRELTERHEIWYLKSERVQFIYITNSRSKFLQLQEFHTLSNRASYIYKDMYYAHILYHNKIRSVSIHMVLSSSKPRN